jgi:hypothetical protein
MPGAASNLRATLADLGLTQTGAARLLGVDPRTMRRWIAGEVATPQPVLRLLDLLTLYDNKRRLMELAQMSNDNE